MKRTLWSFALRPFAVAVTCLPLALAAACSNDKGGAPHLSVAARPTGEPTAEEEWLRSLQMVTVIDAQGETQQQAPEDVEIEIIMNCTSIASSAVYAIKGDGLTSNPPYGPECISYLSNIRSEICVAQTLLAASTLQVEPLAVPGLGRIPQQSEETSEALSELAVAHARSAIDNAFLALDVSPHCYTDPSESLTTGTEFTTAFADAYNTAKEAYDRAVEATLNASDRMRSRSVSPNNGAAKAISGAALSRAAAAHLLVGGDPGLEGSTENPLCVDSQLSPQAKTALQLFRNAAPPPSDILDDSLSINALVNGTNTWNGAGLSQPRDGSIRERLFQFYSYPRLGPSGGKTVDQFFGLNMADFSAARTFLKQEISAFARISSAQIDVPTTGRATHRYYRYSGTAKEPTELPAVAWSARARYSTGAWTGKSLDYLFEQTYSRGLGLMQHEGFDPTTRSEALAPLSMILAGQEVRGLFSFSMGYSFASRFSRYERLRVVVGETGLRCAVQGSVEGASCADPVGLPPPSFPCNAQGQPSLSCLTLAKLDSGPLGADMFAASGTPFTGTLDPKTRIYLVRPRTASLPEVPGNFEALTGSYVTPELVHGVPIAPTLDARVAQVLAPNKKYCSVPQVSCAGVTMDARLPLEDDLSDDNDGVESSWKHYLALAKEAAQEADAIGQDYINSGLTVGGDRAQNEIRQEEQLQRANDALQDVQSTCGTAVDSHSLLGLLTGGDSGKKISASTTACSESSSCATGYDCLAGACIPNLGNLASVHSTDNPDLRRLAACLNDTQSNSTVDPNVGSYPFVTLGDQVQCVTVVKLDHSQVCPTGSAPCPSPASNNGSCAQPSNSTWESLPAKPLNYYSSNGGFASDNVCDILRIARKDPMAQSKQPSRLLMSDLIDSGFLHPMRAQASIKKLYYQEKYGGYIDMGFDGVAIHTDGSFTTGADQSGWPCAATNQPTNCVLDGKEATGLFCERIDCNDSTKREAFHARVAVATYAAAVMLAAGNTDSWDDVVSNAHTQFQYLRGVIRPADNLNLSGSLSGPSVDPDEPGVTQTQYFHGSGSAVLRNNFGYYITDAPRTDGSDYWSTRVRLSNNEFATFDWPYSQAFKINVGGGVSPRDFLWAGLSQFRSDAWSRPTGWLSKVLLGRIKPDQPLDPAVGLPVFQTNDLALVGKVMDTSSFLDGLELICEGIAIKSNGRASGAPPTIATFEDIGRAGEYLQGAADGITNNASRMIFANIPAIALDAGRESSSFGAFPQLGGKMGEAVVGLRIALLQVRTALPQITGELNQFGAELKSLQALLQKNGVLKEIRSKSLESTILNQLTDCATAAAQNLSLNPTEKGSNAATSIIRCANAAAQIALAAQINDLENEAAQLDDAIVQADFAGKASQHARALQEAAIALGEASEQIDSAIATIDGLKKAAKVSIAKAVYLASWQSQQQLQYTSALGTLKTEKQTRYGVALKNAKRLSFFAKRAIEQRLGVRLSEMHDELPLVAAPATWEGKLCDMTGVNYEALQNSQDTSFSEGFIGDYVTKLGNLVESYRIQNNFHQGSDVAVISLRDDVMNVRKECAVPSSNLLLQSAALDSRDAWQAQGCKPISVVGVQQSSMNCIAAVPTADIPILTGNPHLSGAAGYELRFGDGQGCSTGTCGWQPGVGLFQRVTLHAGLYRLSWYTNETGTSGGARAGRILRADGTDVDLDWPAGGALSGNGLEWNRAYAMFSVDVGGQFQVGFGARASVLAAPGPFTIAGAMLEQLPLNGAGMELRSFERTTDTNTVQLAVCEDTDGAIFRATHWKRDCVHQCDSGFSDNCADGPIACYREATFGISQSAIQNGKIFNFSGFAKGNFNYRIDQVALNFVGTGIRDCAASLLPTSCSGAGFVSYSFDHMGPFLVRNFDGTDFRAFLFDGHIEQARGLASERYITNPLGSSDRGLLADYERGELQGRPLDGNFAVRVWEDASINFERIQDVQLVLNYSYWTRFK